jgi:hypothetical protein
LVDRGRSPIARVLRTVAWALFFAFVFGFLIGTWLRNQIEEPLRYLGEQDRPMSFMAARPGGIDHALALILVASQDEEKV